MLSRKGTSVCEWVSFVLSVPDAITLKNGAAITPSGYSNFWATDDAKKIVIK